MKVAFFTEMNFKGKIPRDYPNMRVEFAWMCALGADHYNINDTPQISYDLGLVLTPKTQPEAVSIEKLKQYCKKVGILQEGPFWYFQDYTLEKQIQYFNNLIESDIVFTHNQSDKIYYQGLTNHPNIQVISSLMIEDAIKKETLTPQEQRDGVIIGGNFVSWYGGFDSYTVASEISEQVYAPSMGRKQLGEEQLINNLPYVDWSNWITQLSKFKYAVHLMRTHAAGTFALNCAYLGIPCIGYRGLDTQEQCHPNLTVEVGDILEAKRLIRLLQTDDEFYQNQSLEAKKNYSNIFSEKNFTSIFKSI